jgi:hypothetical protein
VGGGVNVLSGVICEISVTFEKGVDVAPKIGGGMMNGVGVTMPGVGEETGVQTGKGWGATPHPLQELINTDKNRKNINFFIFLLYTCG